MSKLFRLFDGGGDGHLQPKDVTNGLIRLGFKGTASTVDEIFKVMDAAGDGNVGYSELRNWVRGEALATEAMAAWDLSRLPDGAERMCAIMSDFLTLVIKCIEEHGGDIVKFAGDAVSAIFVAETGMREAVTRAAVCAPELHHRVHGYTAWTDEDDPSHRASPTPTPRPSP